MELSSTQWILLVGAALASGCVDAIAGGGGLLTVPSLLAVGLPPHLALGTNKGQSVFGVSAALVRFARAGLLNPQRVRVTFPLGVLGSFGGACAVMWLRPELLKPVVLVLLIAAAVLVAFRPKVSPHEVVIGRKRAFVAAFFTVMIATYDGFFGPGAGTFYIVMFTAVLGLSMTKASAEAKVVNFASNLVAVVLFSARGLVLWKVALPMAVAQLVGGWVGAHLTISGGDTLVRKVLLTVVAALVLKLGADLWS